MSSNRGLWRALRAWVRDTQRDWRTASSESQQHVLALLLIAVAISYCISVAVSYSVMPVSAYVIWLLIGMLLLRFRELLVLSSVTVVAVILALAIEGVWGTLRIAGLISLFAISALILFQAKKQRSGLPVSLGESVLVDLRDRLQSQSKLPSLPDGWEAQSAMLTAHEVDYAGDFLVAELSADKRHLEMILVDVCGKGVAAGTRALQFAGALGGLVGSLPPVALMTAANSFLIRQGTDESFTTAVHVMINLETGRYDIISAGHPPAMRWDSKRREWLIDNARGVALGVVGRPEFDQSHGVLQSGDALMFYTDGIVESRTASIDTGIAWLQRAAQRAVSGGFDGAAQRIVSKVRRGEDDRAVLILSRPLA